MANPEPKLSTRSCIFTWQLKRFGKPTKVGSIPKSIYKFHRFGIWFVCREIRKRKGKGGCFGSTDSSPDSGKRSPNDRLQRLHRQPCICWGPQHVHRVGTFQYSRALALASCLLPHPMSRIRTIKLILVYLSMIDRAHLSFQDFK